MIEQTATEQTTIDQTANEQPRKTELFPQHARMLFEESGISREVAEERGYRSISRKARLRELGFSASQCAVPTLLIPGWTVNGEIGLHQHRPDTPRVGKKGKIVKYEFPTNSHMIVDVHPSIRDKVRNPDIYLLITEGIKKADSAISKGLTCIALMSVWNWRGSNEHGGLTTLPDWDSIALKGKNGARRVIIVFDSDCMLKKPVHHALGRLGAFLKSRGADVQFIYLPVEGGE